MRLRSTSWRLLFCAACVSMIGLAAAAAASMTTDYADPSSPDPIGDTDTYLILVAICIWAVMWTAAWLLFWRRKRANWPLIVGLAPPGLLLAVFVPMLLFCVVAPGIVFTIGLIKLVIWLIGRRCILERSRLKIMPAEAAPAGIVGRSEDEDTI